MALLPTGQAAETAVDRRFIEISVGTAKYQGRQLVSDTQVCWLMERDGRLKNINLTEVTGFKKIGNVFRPYTANELRAKLLNEFGKTYQVDARGYHAVVAPAGKEKACAAIVEMTSNSFTSYFSRRNLKLDRLEAPMVTVVFPTQKEFLDYCDREGVTKVNGLRGYYSPSTNRVALYLDQAAKPARAFYGDLSIQTTGITGAAEDSALAPFYRLIPYGAPKSASTFQDTLAHETTHQMGFNCGLHSRLGDDPTWIIEGMAMLFEGDANRDDARHQSTVTQRMNRERFAWFLEYQKGRRPKKALEEFLTSETLFQTNTLDAYSEAWALTFFLAETRSSNLSAYLKKLANRTDLGEYSAMKRLNDFKAVFGKDIHHLEGQYLRFINELELPQPELTAATPDPLGLNP
jgi:hypothetical protein